MAGFLVIAGITGSLLAFYDELDAVFNQKLAYIETRESPQLPIARLHDQVVSRYPDYHFSSMPTAIEPARSAVFAIDRVRDKEANNQAKAPFQEVYVDPYTGDIIGTRDREQWAWHNVMHKVFWLHRELLLGDIGKLILGIIALVWTVNCFIGFYLTFPRAAKNNKGNNKKAAQKSASKKRASFFKRWLPAWQIRRYSNMFKLNFDLHQAFGLWLWLMFFVIAWSSVGFNLQPVYQPVMQAVVGLDPNEWQVKKPMLELKMNKEINQKYKLDAASVNKANSIAYLSAQADIAAQSNGLKLKQTLGIRWIEEDNQWQMRFITDKDIGKKGGASSITVDATTGLVERVNFGYQSSTANQIDQWLATLHMGHIAEGQNQQGLHLLYQIFLVSMGLALATLSGTGVYLWYKGRLQRQKSAQKKLLQSEKKALIEVYKR